MKRHLLSLLLVVSSFGIAYSQPAQVVKSNPTKVFMHYMPWFDGPENPVAGGNYSWGWHWTMNNKNPNVITNGKRQIASHYYPLIGPYASKDPHVVEYHLLLMKLSGIDGVLIDWYGSEGSNGDVGSLLTNSNALINKTASAGVQFGLVLEDRFWGNIQNARNSLTYAKNNYLNKSNFIRHGTGNDPLMCVFGPITYQSAGQWTDILSYAGEDVEFLPLWYENGDAGSNADGEYAWIYSDYLTGLNNFYANRAPGLKTAMGVAYPGFNDFYAEGGAGSGYFDIPENNGATLNETLAKFDQYKSNLDFLQLATWNDFGEGTIFEPTLENGYKYLVRMQQFTGVPYTENDLKEVGRLFTLRKKYYSDAAKQTQLNQVYAYFAALQIANATALMNSIDGGTPPPVTQSPYGGTARSIPGTLQAEDFDNGGQGVAYNDNDVINSGGQYRTADGVDIENCSEGGYNVGWTNSGEWLEYTVNVTTTGTYTLQARVASGAGGKNFYVELDGANISGTLTVPNTGGWQTWQTLTVTTPNITAGQKILKIVMQANDFNLNYLSFMLNTPVSAPVISSAGTASGTVGAAFNYVITATNAATSYGATGLPAGISINTTTGIISGTPTVSGTFNATVSATNAGGTGTKALTITIDSAPPAQNDLNKKLMMGYQGWFLAQGDNSAPNEWRHWFRSTTTPSAAQLNVDMWPDMSEYTQNYATTMTYSNGQPAKLYSSHDQSTTNKHFQWMQDYNVYGIYLQRFLGEAVNDNRFFQVRNNVLQNVINASQTYNRHFAMMYDISGVPDDGNLYTKLVTDWEYLVNNKNVTNQPGYVKQDGMPVIAIWGIGFRDRGLKVSTFDSLINYFHTKAAPQYRAYIVGGVPGQWRTLDGDSESGAAWGNIYHSLDMISPWSVGRYGDNTGADSWKTTRVVPDLADCNATNVDYMPVIWPGFSWYNMHSGTTALNQIPRNGGNFYWRQAYNAISSGANFIYVAMFDEVDEGTAMFKVSPSAATSPAQASFVNLDADGNTLPSDWYLRLANETQKMLDNTISLTPTIPITPPAGATVSVSSAGTPKEGSAAGTITISGTNITSTITVGYTLSGTAVAADYTANPLLSGTVTLTSAAPSVTITITPVNDGVTEGNETLQLALTTGAGYTVSTGITTLTISDPAGQLPYGGTVRNIPGTIQAEDYDTGGQGIAYNDNDAANSGNQYRTTEGVDVEVCGEGGYNVGWIGTNEWIEYTVNVTTAGVYTLAVRVATPNAGKTMHVEMDGVNISGIIAIPNTTGWQTYQTVNVTTTALTTGQKVMRIVMDNFDFNINYVTFTLNTLPSAPVVSSSGTASGTIGTAFNYTIAASNTPTSFGASGLPAGLSINTSTGIISGTPTVSGIFNTTASATNAGGTGTKAVTITIAAAPPSAPVVLSAGTASGTVGTAFSYAITASNTPTSYGATSLPAGLSVNTSTGIISGTPTASGTFNTTASATNAGGTGTKALVITIAVAPPSAPIVSSAGTASGTVGTAFSYTITASNSPTSYGATGLPSGLSVNTSTGIISGTPTAAGTFNATVSAINAGGTGTKALTITINPSGDPAGVITCYRASGAITVNGNLNENGWNITRPFSKNVTGTTNNTRTFGVLWDNTNLYIGVKVLDANLYSESVNIWDDDAVEIYIDANFNRSTTYDGKDNQIIKGYNKSTVFTKFAITGLQHAWAPITGGYAVEFAIPWSQLNITAPAAGLNIGFDVGNDDDDNSGVRDGQAVWNGAINNYENTSGFGRLTLNAIVANSPAAKPARNSITEPLSPIVNTTQLIKKNVAAVIVPNPVNNGKFNLITTDISGDVTIEIRDIRGALLKTAQKNISGPVLNMDVTGLRPGTYLVQLRNGTDMITKKLIIQ